MSGPKVAYIKMCDLDAVMTLCFSIPVASYVYRVVVVVVVCIDNLTHNTYM